MGPTRADGALGEGWPGECWRQHRAGHEPLMLSVSGAALSPMVISSLLTACTAQSLCPNLGLGVSCFGKPESEIQPLPVGGVSRYFLSRFPEDCVVERPPSPESRDLMPVAERSIFHHQSQARASNRCQQWGVSSTRAALCLPGAPPPWLPIHS